MTTDSKPFSPVRYGMVGGGPPGWIGEIHRKACALDGIIQLVSGCFSSDKTKSKAIGQSLGLSPDRIYESYQQMVAEEARKPPEVRIQFVSVVTPNTKHYEVVKLFLENNFHVVCDKPLAPTLAECETLYTLSQQKNLILAITHTYSGYPTMKHARYLIQQGTLGTIHKVMVEYSQGWLRSAGITITTSTGISSLADVGSHAHYAVRYITGLEIKELVADLNTFVGVIREPDDSNILFRLENGGCGVLVASQSATGEENDQCIRVYGDKGMLEWHQEQPNELKLILKDQPTQILKRGKSYMSDISKKNDRLPPGHPEGYIEAFANIYVNVASTIRAYEHKGSDGKPAPPPHPFCLDFPVAADACYWANFESKVFESSRKKEWVKVSYQLPKVVQNKKASL